MAGQVFRECGIHERYSVARTEYGSPPVVTMAAVLSAPSPHAEPILDHLHTRVDFLLSVSPLLSCGIIQANSDRPRFKTLEPKPTSRDIVALREPLHLLPAGEGGGDADQEAAIRQLRNTCMTTEQTILMDRSKHSLYKDTLWTVALYPVAGTDRPVFVVVLSDNHVLFDGKGTFNVFQALLCAAQPAPDNGEVPPKSDEAFDMSIQPRPDPRLDEQTASTPFWPQTVQKNLLACPVGLRTVDFGASFSPRLKSVAAAHGIKTMHPVLELAAIVALSLAVHTEEAPEPAYAILTSMAINVRGSALSTVPVSTHGLYSGNWVGGRSSKTLCRPTLQFWDQGRHIAQQLVDPDVLRASMSLWAGLRQLPSSTGERLERAEPDAIDGAPLQGDGWVPFLASKVAQTPPISTFLASLGASNLGFFPLDRAHDDALFTVASLCWTQTASPIADAVIVNMIGSGRPRGVGAGAGGEATQARGRAALAPPLAPEQIADGSAEASTAAATAAAAAAPAKELRRRPVATEAVPDIGGLSLGITYRKGSVDEAILERFETYLTRLLSLLAQDKVDESDDVASIRKKLI